MKTIFIIMLLFWIPAIANCQGNQSPKKDPNDINFKVVTQQEPYYPGGDQKLYTYFYNNIHYSDAAIAKKLAGNVMVSFDVMPDSTLANLSVLSGIEKGIDEEILQLVKPLKYAPGIQNGTATKMNVILSVPVRAN
ncbi:MAG: energy transducer TonB [Bacteroidales bacterium]|jgi:outer membrane biosynthesis protein TonB